MIRNGRLLAVVPARGGSKRLPGKNILELAGKPLIAWSIEAGLQSKYVDRVVVSTNDEEIGNVAREYGADVPFMRPEELARDESTTIDMLRHALYELGEEGEEYEYLILLQPTSPLRTEWHINEAVEKLIQNNADNIIGVTEVDHPIEWTNTLPKNLSMEGFLRKEMENKRSQDFPVRYRVNGAIYLMRIDVLLKSKTLFFGRNSYAYVFDKTDSIDIDDMNDFLIAKAMLKHRICA